MEGPSVAEAVPYKSGKKAKKEKKVAEIEIEETRDVPLRSWLPEKKLRESIRAETFLSVVGTGVFTILFVIMDVGGPSGLKVAAEAGSVLASVALGFCLSNCWAEWKRGSTKREDAIRIDVEVEYTIQKFSENLQKTVHSLGVLSEKDDANALKIVYFFLGQEQNDIRGYIHRKATEISNLGFDHNLFLKEKEARFSELQKLAANVEASLSGAREPKSLDEIIGQLVKTAGSLTHESTRMLGAPE